MQKRGDPEEPQHAVEAETSRADSGRGKTVFLGKEGTGTALRER